VFGSEAWAHIPDEKRKALQPKSKKCIFVGYFEDVKSYRLLQPHSNEIIIRKYVKFNEYLSTYKPSSVIVPSSIPNFFASAPILVSSSNVDNEDENPPLPAHLHLVGFVEHEPTPTPQLPRWVHTTREVASDLASDPLDLHHICS
jgi:hypothetical protein